MTQNALNNADPSGPAYNFPFIVEGVVVGIHYPNAGDNHSVTDAIEYDVDVISIFGMGRLYNLVRIASISGYEDVDHDILRVASRAVDTTQTYVNIGGIGQRPTPRLKTDGDRVLVAFINGNAHRGVIIGVLTHQLTKVSWADVTGNALSTGGALVRRWLHRGTEFIRDELGSIALTFGDHPDPPPGMAKQAKKFTMKLGDFTLLVDNTSSPTVLSITDANNGEMFKVSGGNITLRGGSEQVARKGDSVKVTITPANIATLVMVAGGNPVTASAPVDVTGTVTSGNPNVDG